MTRPAITKPHYELLAELRRTLRKFHRFSSEAAKSAGLTPQQHQALLAIKGFVGRDFVSIGELASHLHIRHHSAVGLVDRLSGRGLVRRTASLVDRRRVDVRVTPAGESKIERLSKAHLRELQLLGPGLRRILRSMAAE
ncbi:MAG TPA: helix-turn-helix domain-containing protein [Opitutaceae bacterium]|jgi:DNA-binding MarR family transcriptional regulator